MDKGENGGKEVPRPHAEGGGRGRATNNKKALGKCRPLPWTAVSSMPLSLLLIASTANCYFMKNDFSA